MLKEHPSYYLRQWFFATQPIEEPDRREDIVSIFQLFGGEDHAMFASDWPHHDFDHPQHCANLPFPEASMRKIMGENALRFLNLPKPQQYAGA